jgi:hypothetical protein
LRDAVHEDRDVGEGAASVHTHAGFPLDFHAAKGVSAPGNTVL